MKCCDCKSKAWKHDVFLVYAFVNTLPIWEQTAIWLLCIELKAKSGFSHLLAAIVQNMKDETYWIPKTHLGTNGIIILQKNQKPNFLNAADSVGQLSGQLSGAL